MYISSAYFDSLLSFMNFCNEHVIWTCIYMMEMKVFTTTNQWKSNIYFVKSIIILCGTVSMSYKWRNEKNQTNNIKCYLILNRIKLKASEKEKVSTFFAPLQIHIRKYWKCFFLEMKYTHIHIAQISTKMTIFRWFVRCVACLFISLYETFFVDDNAELRLVYINDCPFSFFCRHPTHLLSLPMCYHCPK